MNKHHTNRHYTFVRLGSKMGVFKASLQNMRDTKNHLKEDRRSTV